MRDVGAMVWCMGTSCYGLVHGYPGKGAPRRVKISGLASPVHGVKVHLTSKMFFFAA